MPHPCQYCGSVFRRLPDLTRHQKTAKYCLNLRCNEDEIRKMEIYECECGGQFSQKSALKRHKKSCQSVASNTINSTVINDNRTINTQNVVVFFGSTASNLTPEGIAKIVFDELSIENVEKGLANMTAHVAPHVFTNEKGNWIIRAADASRNKLMIRTDDGDIADINAAKSSKALRAPFRQVSMSALTKTKNPESVKTTIQNINDDHICEKEIGTTLLKLAPAKFESTPIFGGTFDEVEEKSIRESNLLLAKYEEEQNQKVNKNAEKFLNEITKGCESIKNGMFWNPLHKLVWTNDGTQFKIMGTQSGADENMKDLTNAQLDQLRSLGLIHMVSNADKTRTISKTNGKPIIENNFECEFKTAQESEYLQALNRAVRGRKYGDSDAWHESSGIIFRQNYNKEWAPVCMQSSSGTCRAFTDDDRQVLKNMGCPEGLIPKDEKHDPTIFV